MKHFAFTCLLVISLCLFFSGSYREVDLSQRYSVLSSSDWRTTQSWFGTSTVVLKPIPRLPDPEAPGLSDEERIEAITRYRDQELGERLKFDSSGKLDYSYKLFCAVGEILRDVKTFQLNGNEVIVEHRKYRWDEKDVPYQSSRYEASLFSRDSIVLKLKLD